MSNLLKQAIADAKAVRATALANAKAALAEAFTPRLQSMLGEKLRQEVEDDETSKTTPETPGVPPAPVADAGLDAGNPLSDPEASTVPAADDVAVDDADPAIDAGDEEAPLAADAPAPEAGAEVTVDGEAPIGDEAGTEKLPTNGEDEIEEELDLDEILGAGNPDPVQQTLELTEEKASSDYKKTTKGAKTEDPQGPSKEFAKGPGKADKNGTSGSLTAKGDSRKASTDYKKDTAGHKTPDPQGASKELAKGPGKADKNVTGKTLEEGDEEIADSSIEEILKELEQDLSTEDCGAETVGAASPQGEDEIVNLDELFESDDKDADDEEGAKEEEDKDEDDKPAFLKENISLKKELEQYRNTVNFLRGRINEVNLLNSKLLYTTKLFKAGNFSNEQKLKIIETMDLTKSAREAKLVYATLAESMNFGGKKTIAAPAAPAKKPVTSSTVKSITEGLASKPVASTKPTKVVISEGTEMANRFQKLAGIKKL